MYVLQSSLLTHSPPKKKNTEVLWSSQWILASTHSGFRKPSETAATCLGGLNWAKAIEELTEVLPWPSSRTPEKRTISLKKKGI